MNKKIIGFTSIFVFTVLATLLLVEPASLTTFDLHVTNAVYNSISDLTPGVQILTTLGNVSSVTVLVIIFSLLLALKKEWLLTLFLIIDVSTVAAINHYIKFFFTRPRPQVEHLVSASGFSFPSGHSAATMALCLSLFFIFKLIYGNKQKWIGIVILVIPFIIAFTRIYLGVHYFSDTLAGLSYSAAVTILIYRFF